MKRVSVVEIYTTKFSRGLFYGEFRNTWCLLKKCIAMNPKNHWVNNIFSKTLDSKRLFLFKIKIKRSPGCPNKEYTCSLQTRFQQNIRTYHKSKKKLHCSMIGKILHIGKLLSKERCLGTSLIFPKYYFFKIALGTRL